MSFPRKKKRFWLFAGTVALTFADHVKRDPHGHFGDQFLNPQCNINRAGHPVLAAHDLPASRDFYTEVLGLVATKTPTRSSCELRSATTTALH